VCGAKFLDSVSGVSSNEKIPKTNKSWKEMQMDLLQVPR
jgi:hypothetical protein